MTDKCGIYLLQDQIEDKICKWCLFTKIPDRGLELLQPDLPYAGLITFAQGLWLQPSIGFVLFPFKILHVSVCNLRRFA